MEDPVKAAVDAVLKKHEPVERVGVTPEKIEKDKRLQHTLYNFVIGCGGAVAGLLYAQVVLWVPPSSGWSPSLALQLGMALFAGAGWLSWYMAGRG